MAAAFTPPYLRIEGDRVTLQVFENTRGISTHDRVTFLKHQMQAVYGDDLLGRRLSGAGDPIDGGPDIRGEKINIGQASFNPTKRIIPRELVRTNIPMIDVFNCLVKSQKIPIFSSQVSHITSFSCVLPTKPTPISS